MAPPLVDSGFIDFVYTLSSPKPDPGLALATLVYNARLWLEIYKCSDHHPKALEHLGEWLDCICPVSEARTFLLPDSGEALRDAAELEMALEGHPDLQQQARTVLLRRMRRYQVLQRYPAGDWSWILADMGAFDGGLLSA